jgi:hypothetical protein
MHKMNQFKVNLKVIVFSGSEKYFVLDKFT